MKIRCIDEFENIWLGLGDTSKLRFKNPLLANRTTWDKENPGLYELRLMRKPEYLFFAAEVLLGIELHPFQAAILEELWIRPFPMLIATRGGSKTFLLAILALLKCVLNNDMKVIIVGGAFRQAKIVFEYMETIWNNAPILRSICDTHSRPAHLQDQWIFRMNTSTATAIPLGSGEKIRGLRANLILVDEMASINPDVYETVIAGFTAVTKDPVENVKEFAKREVMKKEGVWKDEDEVTFMRRIGNQSVIAGTADYDFMHFAQYWKRYKSIVESKGDKNKLAEAIGTTEIPEWFDWRDYSVIRLPYELVPPGFMDEKQISRAKATVNTTIFLREYCAVFPRDSDGFFRRTLIEGCVVSETNPIYKVQGKVLFDPALKGKAGHKYIIAIDPASESDNFAIVVIEIHKDHRRIVYCWTATKKDFNKMRKKGLTRTHDFHSFCSRKIRDLMRLFPTVRIGMDAMGGGYMVAESLHDPDKMEPDELPIWPIVDLDKSQDTDAESGLHILELVQFVSSDWTTEANHGLKKDLEDKVLLFPRYDPASLELGSLEDTRKLSAGDSSRLVYSMEDVLMELEELKYEMTTIMHTRTPTGRERWDTPEIKLPNNRKGRMRKDRYSALLIGNTIARQLERALGPIDIPNIGGVVGSIYSKGDGPLYTGPAWFTQSMNSPYMYKSIKRSV